MDVEAQLDLMDRLEADFRPRLEDSLADGMLAMLEAFRLTRLPGPEPLDHLQKLDGLLRELWTAAARGSSSLMAAFLEAKADTVRDLVDQYIQQFGANTARQILDTSRRQIRDMMTGGLAAGQAADAVYGELLEKIPQIAAVRSLLISRTEIHSATQFAAWQLARRSSVPLVKVWNSVNDERTRDFGELGRISQFNHRVMDGQRAALNDSFLVPRIIGGYENLMFPGDPRGSAGNVINCRCIQTYERADR